MSCLEDTYNFIANKNDKENWIIIHAIVQRPSDRLRHPHAVIYNTIDKHIYEVSNSFKTEPIRFPFMLWLNMGNCSNIKQYTFQEYTSLLLIQKKWDFFHLNN